MPTDTALGAVARHHLALATLTWQERAALHTALAHLGLEGRLSGEDRHAIMTIAEHHAEVIAL